MIRTKKILIVILVTAFLLRIIPALIFNYPVINDAVAYDDIGKNLASHFSYSRDGSTPSIERPPGYPVFLALLYFVFGHNVQVVIFIQVLLSVLSVYLLYLLAKIFLREISALFCALLAAIYPMFIYYNLFLYSENLAIFTCLLFLYTLFIGLKENNKFYIVISGFSFVIFMLTKPLFAPLLLLIFGLLFLYRKDFNLKYTISLFFLPIVLVWGAWILRNNLVFQQPIPFGIGLGPVLFVGNHPNFNGVWPQDYGEINKLAPANGLSSVEYDNFLKAKAIDQIKKEPTQTIRLFFVKLINYFSVVQDLSQSKIYKQGGGLSIVAFQLLFLFYKFYKVFISILSIIGTVIILWKLKKNKNFFQLFILMLIWYAALVHALIYVDERYHLPVFALHLILSIYTLEYVYIFIIKNMNRNYLFK